MAVNGQSPSTALEDLRRRLMTLETGQAAASKLTAKLEGGLKVLTDDLLPSASAVALDAANRIKDELQAKFASVEQVTSVERNVAQLVDQHKQRMIPASTADVTFLTAQGRRLDALEVTAGRWERQAKKLDETLRAHSSFQTSLDDLHIRIGSLEVRPAVLHVPDFTAASQPPASVPEPILLDLGAKRMELVEGDVKSLKEQLIKFQVMQNRIDRLDSKMDDLVAAPVSVPTVTPDAVPTDISTRLEYFDGQIHENSGRVQRLEGRVATQEDYLEELRQKVLTAQPARDMPLGAEHFAEALTADLRSEVSELKAEQAMQLEVLTKKVGHCAAILDAVRQLAKCHEEHGVILTELYRGSSQRDILGCTA